MWLTVCFVCIHVAKNIYKIKYLTFKMPHKHFNNNRKSHVKPKTNLEKLILRKYNLFFKILNFFNFLVYCCTFLATKHNQTMHQFEDRNQNKIWTWFEAHKWRLSSNYNKPILGPTNSLYVLGSKEISTLIPRACRT